MGRFGYTKAELEQIVYRQLENLNAMNDLLQIMKLQNELIENANTKLKDEITGFKKTFVKYPTTLRNRKKDE
ncbi:hypothetical protein [Poritiphilus flavus]|uniref:Uncharacterized protein n=1 Tax=Poritiphilus flavus TaxID=2697053 RepID=A0A6L9EHG6_9FLAO|nr:hypothetical protein [Poritiphilus flavus]NAS13679.1 hypothetical protein [Poritiphilus flavus]